MSDETDWQAQRREAARVQGDLLTAREDAEHQKAEALLAEFTPIMAAHGPAPQPLTVGGFDGRGHAKSNVTGWYLRKNQSIGLGTDGKFYILSAPIGLKERLAGVKLIPSRPPIQLGKGGRDGEALDLTEALENLLPGWRRYLPGG